MPRAFNADAKRSVFELPELTRQQIKALILDLDMDAREVVIRAVADLWRREIGTPDRDLAVELDELRARLAALESGAAQWGGARPGAGRPPTED